MIHTHNQVNMKRWTNFINVWLKDRGCLLALSDFQILIQQNLMPRSLILCSNTPMPFELFQTKDFQRVLWANKSPGAKSAPTKTGHMTCCHGDANKTIVPTSDVRPECQSVASKSRPTGETKLQILSSYMFIRVCTKWRRTFIEFLFYLQSDKSVKQGLGSFWRFYLLLAVW